MKELDFFGISSISTRLDTTLSTRLYLADNLAYIPYTVIDEPLFLIHHIDLMVTVIGANILHTIKESLKLPENYEVIINKETGKEEVGFFLCFLTISVDCHHLMLSITNLGWLENPPRKQSKAHDKIKTRKVVPFFFFFLTRSTPFTSTL